METFRGTSYLTQVRRLRRLAEVALLRFPVKNAKLHFINHGENTTFRVEAGKKKYLLRVHRYGYHTPEAIGEELAWLKRLRESTDLSVQKPVASKQGKLLEAVATPEIPEPRQCDLLEWVEGKFIWKSTRPQDVRRLGMLMAELHHSTRGRKVKYRRYWDAEGLVGKKPKFSWPEKFSGVPAAQQRIINEARGEISAYLCRFEKKFAERQGLIHADLHFGNFVVQPDRIGAIDFDDCGFGFHAYDLAIPLTQLKNLCEKKPEKNFLAYVSAIQEGYASVGKWSDQDAEALPYFLAARRVLMLGWLASRAENPKLQKHLITNAKNVSTYLRTDWRKF
jgi:Ser/Thr protein kinase RdoA (MazF antagonist)